MGSEGNGCCPLNCSHVYGYTTLLERLYQRRLIAIEPVDLSKTSMLLLNNVGAILPVSALLLIPGTLHETDIVSQYWNASRTPVDLSLIHI